MRRFRTDWWVFELVVFSTVNGRVIYGSLIARECLDEVVIYYAPTPGLTGRNIVLWWDFVL